MISPRLASPRLASLTLLLAFVSLAACEPPEGDEEPIETERVGDVVEAENDQPAENMDEQDTLDTLEEIDPEVTTPGDGPCEVEPEPIIAVSLAAAEGDDGDLIIHISRTADSGEAPLLLTPALHGDDGSETHARVVLPTVSLSAGETIEIPTSVTKLGLDLSDQEFSGRVEVSASPQSDDPSVAVPAVISDPLFFHQVSAQTYDVYDIDELAAHHGDFKGTLLNAGLDIGEESGSRIVGQPKGDKPDDADAVEYVESGSPGENEKDDTVGQIGAGGGDQDDPNTVVLVQKTVCFNWYVQANDSSIMFRSNAGTPLPLEEDWGAGTGDDTTVNGSMRPGAYWRARNAIFQMAPYDSVIVWGPAKSLDENGCYTWWQDSADTDTYRFRISSEVKDSSGNLWRFSETWNALGTAPQCPRTDILGSPLCLAGQGTPRYISTYWIPFPNSNAVTIGMTGANLAEWSIIAHAAAALYRLPSGLTNSEINICLSSDGGSQNFGNNFSAKRGCIEMGGTTGARRKFGVAHEIGHTVGYLYAADDFNGATHDYDAEYEKDGLSNSPPLNGPANANCTTSSGSMTPDKGPNYLPTSGVARFVDDAPRNQISNEGECYAPCSLYNLWSYEWNSLALREAFAHTYATRVMNDRARDAIFVYGRGNESATSPSATLVRLSLDDGADELAYGGRLQTVCCEPGYPSGCPTDVATIRDWTGALWNWYASSWDELCASPNPGFGTVEWIDVMNVFRVTLLAIGSNDKKQGWNYFTNAVAWTTGLPNCAEATWAFVGAKFGIDN